MGAQEGRRQSWHRLIEEESPRNVPVIREKGFSVWSVVGYFLACKGDREQVLADYAGKLTPEELAAALAYYEANSDAIDEKLKEIAS